MHIEYVITTNLLFELLSEQDYILGLSNEPIKRLSFVFSLLRFLFSTMTAFALLSDQLLLWKAIDLPE